MKKNFINFFFDNNPWKIIVVLTFFANYLVVLTPSEISFTIFVLMFILLLIKSFSSLKKYKENLVEKKIKNFYFYFSEIKENKTFNLKKNWLLIKNINLLKILFYTLNLKNSFKPLDSPELKKNILFILIKKFIYLKENKIKNF